MAKNYFTLRRISLLWSYFAYIDVPEYLADQLFIKHKVTVHFGDEMCNPDNEYMVIFCKVRKSDEERFLAALDDMFNKMLLCGHPDYEAYCEQVLSKMEHGAEALREGRALEDENLRPAG